MAGVNTVDEENRKITRMSEIDLTWKQSGMVGAFVRHSTSPVPSWIGRRATELPGAAARDPAAPYSAVVRTVTRIHGSRQPDEPEITMVE